jgi:hypothetical protein
MSASPVAVVVLSSDGRSWRHLPPIATEFMGRWRQSHQLLLRRMATVAIDQIRPIATVLGCVATMTDRSSERCHKIWIKILPSFHSFLYLLKFLRPVRKLKNIWESFQNSTLWCTLSYLNYFCYLCCTFVSFLNFLFWSLFDLCESLKGFVHLL